VPFGLCRGPRSLVAADVVGIDAPPPAEPHGKQGDEEERDQEPLHDCLLRADRVA
jgi:hypothetical protein